MNDVFVVVYQTQDGRRKFRNVLAGSLDDARQAHEEHHPDDQIVAVNPHGSVADNQTNNNTGKTSSAPTRRT